MPKTMLARIGESLTRCTRRLRDAAGFQPLSLSRLEREDRRILGRALPNDGIVRWLAPLAVTLTILNVSAAPHSARTAQSSRPAVSAQVAQVAPLAPLASGNPQPAPVPDANAAAASPAPPASAPRLASRGEYMTDRARMRAYVCEIIDRVAPEEGVDPALVRAVVQAESEFNPRSHSKTGAIGLMQLMPDTAQGLGINDRYDVEQNIRGGTHFLRYLIDTFGDVRLAVAAYNAGPGSVRRHGGIPPFDETQRYVPKVLRLRELFASDPTGSFLPQ